MKYMQQEKGFTLVELAISLVVIGLLMGGILKGRELISNSKINTAIRQIRSYDAAANMFRDSYGALPGDITNPGDRLPKCTTTTCNMGGNGSGRVADMADGESAVEQYNFFPHMVKAGLIPGPEGGTMAETGSYAYSHLFSVTLPLERTLTGDPPYLWVFFSRAMPASPAGVLPWVPAHVYQVRLTKRDGQMLDSKMDDGKFVSGQMREVSSCFENGCGFHILAGF